MPRKTLLRSNSNHYHITARSNNREFFPLPTQAVWKIMTARLAKIQKDYQIQIASFVLMDNHFHLLVLTPKEPIDRIMYFFMKGVTLDIQKATGRINKIFGGRYKGTIIMDQRYLLSVFKYICRNPVAAKITTLAEDYPYSTFSHEWDNIKSFFVVDEIVSDRATASKWINESYDEREVTSIRYGLRKSVFSYAKDRNSHKSIEPKFDLGSVSR